MPAMRLDKFIAESLPCTRSEARSALADGRVFINGVVCKKADEKVDPDLQQVTADGRVLTHETFVYIMVNKPLGVVSASRDRRDVTVVDLVTKEFPRRQLFPAGRLDKASTGFVLVTDDGAFAHDILSPRRHVPKTYTVVLDTPLTPEMTAGFLAGVTLADGETMAPAEVSAVSPDGYTVRVVLHQGVYHQIKRMFGVYGAGVNALNRDAIGGLMLDPALGPGQFQVLTKAQVKQICGAD